MKRIIYFIFTLVIVLGAMSVTVDAAQSNNVADYEQLFKALGVFSDTDAASLDSYVSRGEFTNYVLKLIDVSDIAASSDGGFWDVTTDNPYYQAISDAKALGMIKGYDDGSFDPYAYITPVQATSVMLNVLGYDKLVAVKGPFVNSVYDIARDLKMDTVLTQGGQYLTTESMLKLFYEAIKCNIYDSVVYRADKITYRKGDETILEKYRDISLITGINTISKLSDRENDTREVLIGYDLIGGVPADFDAYYGYEVECWAEKIDDTTYNYIYMMKTQSNSSVSVDFDDIDNVNAKKISYYKNNSLKRIDLDTATRYIYNGVEVNFSNHSIDDLFAKTCGEIEFIDNNNDGTYDFASIKAYDTLVLQYADFEHEIFYDSVSPYCNQELDKYDLYEIYDQQGKPVDAPEAGSVVSLLKSFDGEYVKMIYTTKVINGRIDSINSDGDCIIGGVAYKLTDELKTYGDSALFNVGTQASFFLDIRNRIAYIKPATSSSMNIAYLVRVIYDDNFPDEVKLKLFGTDGEYNTFHVASQIKIDGKSYKRAMDKLKALGASDTFTPIPVSYKTDDAGELIYIDTPVKNHDREDEHTLVRRYSSEEGEMYFKKSTNANYELSFGGRYLSRKGEYYSFIVDDESMDWLDLTLFPNLVDDSEYKMDIYSFSEDSPFAEIILVYGKASTKVNDTVYLFSKNTEALDENGDVVQQISCYNGPNPLNLTVASGYESVISNGNVISENARTNMTEDQINACGGLKVGDLFRVGTDHKGNVILCEKIYDYENKLFINPTKNAVSPNRSHEFNSNAKVAFMLGNVYSYTNGYTRYSSEDVDLADPKLDSYLETVYGTGIMYTASKRGVEITPIGTSSQLLGAKYGEKVKIFTRNEYTRPQQVYFIK